jgi:GNAT superfamily N-acetyltransferase
MISDSALALFDAQVRRGTAEEPGVTVQTTDTIVRWVAEDDDGSSWITWSGLDAAGADAAIADQVAYFRGRGQQFEWKLYDYDQPSDLGGRLLAAGFVPDDEETVMVAEAAVVAAEPRLPEGVTLRELTGEAGVAELFAIHDEVFASDETRLRAELTARVRSAPESMAMVAAWYDGAPISTARIEFPPGVDFAGLWGGGTLPAWRSRGLYRALVAWRARLAVRRGYRYLQVDALPTSQPILARLGFEALARTTPYVWDPELAAGSRPA